MMRRIWTTGALVSSKICFHDRSARVHSETLLCIANLHSKNRSQKKYAVRPFAGSCTAAGSALVSATGAAFAIGDDVAGDLALSCFFWLRDALSLSISFRTACLFQRVSTLSS